MISNLGLAALEKEYGPFRVRELSGAMATHGSFQIILFVLTFDERYHRDVVACYARVVVRAKPLGPLLLALSATFGMLDRASAEHGSPGYVSLVADETVLPKNSLIPLRGVNGVTFGFDSLARAKPRLVGPKRSVPLRVADSFDDLEGHARPFDSDDTGYGENLLLFAPTAALVPGERYELVMDGCSGTCGPDDRPFSLFGFKVGAASDTQAPKFLKEPFLGAIEELGPTIFTALDTGGELPYFVIVDLVPQTPGARPKRMIAALRREDQEPADRNCDTTYVYDHEGGVYTMNVDRDYGHRYLARITAMDISGNRRAAPGKGLGVTWTGGLSVCNDPSRAAPPPAPAPPLPNWSAPPRSTGELVPASETENATRETITLPVVASTELFVDIALTRAAEGLSVRLLATVDPKSDDPCDVAYVTNHQREKLEAKRSGTASARLTIVDALGRRVLQPGPPLSLSPRTTELEVCIGEPRRSH